MKSLEVVQELYESKEEAEKYAKQTEELIHQQTSDDVRLARFCFGVLNAFLIWQSDYMKNFQQRFEELKELKKKFTMAVSNSPSNIAATSFSSAATRSDSVGAVGALGTQSANIQAQAAQRLFAAQQLQQQQATSVPQPAASSASMSAASMFPSLPNLTTNPPSPIANANFMPSLSNPVRSAADLSTLAQTNSVLNSALGGPNPLGSLGSSEGNRKRPNPSATGSVSGTSPSSITQASAVPGTQAAGNAAKRPRTSGSGQQQPTAPRGGGGNASQLLHFLTQAEGKIKANYVSTAGRQQPQERLYFESLLQEVNQIVRCIMLFGGADLVLEN
jgi:hypothetical protein